MKKTAATMALVLACGTVQAKCMDRVHTFEGQVTDASGKPVVGALVGASWLKYGEAAAPAITVTNAKGRYRLVVRFTPGDDMVPFQIACKQRIGRINLVAYAGKRSAIPEAVAIVGLNQEMPVLTIDK